MSWTLSSNSIKLSNCGWANCERLCWQFPLHCCVELLARFEYDVGWTSKDFLLNHSLWCSVQCPLCPPITKKNADFFFQCRYRKFCHVFRTRAYGKGIYIYLFSKMPLHDVTFISVTAVVMFRNYFSFHTDAHLPGPFAKVPCPKIYIRDCRQCKSTSTNVTLFLSN